MSQSGRHREPLPRRSGGNRRRSLLGLTAVLVGLSLIGYASWEIFGTNWVAWNNQRALVRQTEQAWAHGTTFTDTRFGAVDAIIRIPAFGANYAIPVLPGVSEDVLARGYGHYDGTAAPGQRGNYAIAAHRVTHGEPLRRMPDLVIGDEVIVETRTHRFHYVLDTGGDDLRVGLDNTWVIAPLPSNPDPVGIQPRQVDGQRLITLTTCAELFHTGDRLVAFGQLESVEDKNPDSADAADVAGSHRGATQAAPAQRQVVS